METWAAQTENAATVLLDKRLLDKIDLLRLKEVLCVVLIGTGRGQKKTWSSQLKAW